MEAESGSKFEEKIEEAKKSPFLDMALRAHRFVHLSKRHNGRPDEVLDKDSAEGVTLRDDEYSNTVGDTINDDDVDVEPILLTEEYSQYVDRNASHIFDRLHLMSEIRALHEAGELAEGSPIPVVGASGSQAIGEWWDSAFDRDLIRGTHRFGFGSYTQMRLDPELVFNGRVEPLTEATVDAMVVDVTALSESNRVKKEGDGSDDAPGSAKKKGVDDDEEMVDATQDDDKGTNSASDSDAESEKECPEGLIIRERAAVAHLPEDELQARKWPLVQVLNIRVRKLVRGYIRLRKKADRQAKADLEVERARQAKEERRLARVAQKETDALERQRKAEEANMVWSKKEKQDFSKYYAIIGAPPLDNDGKPSWGLVKLRAGLNRKTPELVEAYGMQFELMCKFMLWADSKARTKGIALHEYLTDEKNVHKPEYKAHELDEARVTLMTAKKLHERRELLQVLRRDVLRELSRPGTRERIDKLGAVSPRDRLPGWYELNRLEVDIGLLQGVATHGFDPNQTALDHSLPFRALLAQGVIDFVESTVQAAREDPSNTAADSI